MRVVSLSSLIGTTIAATATPKQQEQPLLHRRGRRKATSGKLVDCRTPSLLLLGATILLLTIIILLLVFSSAPSSFLEENKSSSSLLLLSLDRKSNSTLSWNSNQQRQDQQQPQPQPQPQQQDSRHDKRTIQEAQSQPVVDNVAAVAESAASSTKEEQEPGEEAVLEQVAVGEGGKSLPEKKTCCFVSFKDRRMELCHFVPFGKNFGDLMGPDIVHALLRQRFGPNCNSTSYIRSKNLYSSKREKSTHCLFTLGSIFQFAANRDHVWGTGIKPTEQWKINQFGTFPVYVTLHAVRGPKTLAELRKQHHKQAMRNKALPYVDPGYLIPYLFPEYMQMAQNATQQQPQQQQICFVPHANDLENTTKTLDTIPNRELVHVISPINDWQPVVADMASHCTHVAASSLHGLILADALGLPILWFQWYKSKTYKREGTFKYIDYFSSTQRKPPILKPTMNVADITNLNQYHQPFSEQRRNEIAQQFASSFPYHLFETVQETVC